MSPSTASTKSVCLTLALVALTTSSSAASSIAIGNSNSCSSRRDCEVGNASLGSSTVLGQLPIYLTSLAPTTHKEGDHDTTAQRNASAYHSEDNHHDGTIKAEEYVELPEELVDMIANAKWAQQNSSSLATTPPSGVVATLEDEVRYYPTYAEGELCSLKSIAEFEIWEESYTSLADCCDATLSWDYDACVGLPHRNQLAK